MIIYFKCTLIFTSTTNTHTHTHTHTQTPTYTSAHTYAHTHTTIIMDIKLLKMLLKYNYSDCMDLTSIH